MRAFIPLATLCLMTSLGCDRTKPAPEGNQPTTKAGSTAPGATQGVVKPGEKAVVGQPAPDFELADLDGKKVKLSSFAGKTIVLEGQSPSDGKLVNYAVAALEAVEAGREVAVKETKAYGCSVKY